MPISQQEIKYLLTGGTNNTNPYASLGGYISRTEISSSGMDNLFGDVTTDQALNGDITYRCIAIVNTSSLAFRNATWYMEDDPKDWMSIGINQNEPHTSQRWPEQQYQIQTIQEEHETPVGCVFEKSCSNWHWDTDPNICHAFGFPDRRTSTDPPMPIPEGDFTWPFLDMMSSAFWIKREIPPGSTPTSNYSFTIRLVGNPGA